MANWNMNFLLKGWLSTLISYDHRIFMRYVKIKDPGDGRFGQLSGIIAIQILESPISSPPMSYSPWLDVVGDSVGRGILGESPKLMIRRWIKRDQKPETSRRYTQKCDPTLKWHCEVLIFSFVLKGVGCEVFGCKQRMPTNEKCSIQYYSMFLFSSVSQIGSSIGTWCA